MDKLLCVSMLCVRDDGSLDINTVACNVETFEMFDTFVMLTLL